MSYTVFTCLTDLQILQALLLAETSSDCRIWSRCVFDVVGAQKRLLREKRWQEEVFKTAISFIDSDGHHPANDSSNNNKNLTWSSSRCSNSSAQLNITAERITAAVSRGKPILFFHRNLVYKLASTVHPIICFIEFYSVFMQFESWFVTEEWLFLYFMASIFLHISLFGFDTFATGIMVWNSGYNILLTSLDAKSLTPVTIPNMYSWQSIFNGSV